ncbi:MAG: sulfatase [Planctomycetota bacterium]|nr:sulfatase [Planctomycetota bacterium]MDG2141932.1 sulfatase [Planctomycetota bacterium]
MHKPSILFSLGLVAALTSGCTDPAPSSAGASGPLAGKPVVIILFDAFSAKHVSHLGYGKQTTPNLDQLAAEGTTFENAFSPTPYTLASIPSLLTGRLPDRHGVTQAEHILPEHEITLAELLAERNYQTFNALANIQGGALHKLEQGFEIYEELFRGSDDPKGAIDIVEPTAFPEVLERWQASRDVERPPLYYLHVLQPHMPYDPPTETLAGLVNPNYDGPFKDGITKEWMVDFTMKGGQAIIGEGPNRISKADARHVRGLYDGSIVECDRVLGEIVAGLKKSGVYDDALIIVTSDHGEAMWQHNVLGHSSTVFDEMMHVPLVVKLPKDMESPVKRVSNITSLMDIMPSICAWMDVPAPRDLDGEPFAQLINESPDEDRRLLMRTYHRDPVIASRSAKDKIISSPGGAGQPRNARHFDIAQDKAEKRGQKVLPETPEHALALQLEADFEALWALDAGTVTDQEQSAAEIKALAELGYTDNENVEAEPAQDPDK